MGQKTNPNIFRLGKIKEWKSKYIEKKTTESSTIIFQDLEIRKFIYQFFLRHQLKIQDYQSYYSEKSLHIYIAYYNLIKPVVSEKNVKLKHKKFFSKYFQKKISKIENKIIKNQLYYIKAYKKTSYENFHIFPNHYLSTKKNQRLTYIKKIGNYINKINYPTVNQEKTNLFILKILKSIKLFTKKKYNILLNLNQLNKENCILQTVKHKNKKILHEELIQLRKYQQNEFFQKGINILYNFMVNSQNPTFLADFITFYLKKLKKQPNFFLRFLEEILKILIIFKFSKIKGIKIKIKGRFTRSRRSRQRTINIGKGIPVMQLNKKINYGESTLYNRNGTSGVKIWTLKQI